MNPSRKDMKSGACYDVTGSIIYYLNFIQQRRFRTVHHGRHLYFLLVAQDMYSYTIAPLEAEVTVQPSAHGACKDGNGKAGASGGFDAPTAQFGGSPLPLKRRPRRENLQLKVVAAELRIEYLCLGLAHGLCPRLHSLGIGVPPQGLNRWGLIWECLCI